MSGAEAFKAGINRVLEIVHDRERCTQHDDYDVGYNAALGDIEDALRALLGEPAPDLYTGITRHGGEE